MRAVALVLLGAACAGAAMADEAVHYTRDIKPILANHCYACHGPDDAARKGNLRLDTFEGATAVRDSGAPIVPGNPDASTLLARVVSHDADERMPPPQRGPALNEQQVNLLRRWISDGADFERHWSFVAPVAVAPPAVGAHADRVRNAIDNFILARLEREGIEPNAEADKEVLLRRLSLDLIGLPPTVEEMNAYLADESPDAYEKQVDRLLESPHFGERWGAVWLDLARYADTKGYEKDERRTMWPYRDWVIKAINADMPLDEFTREQLAGDLLPEPTQDQIVATAFHRNTMTNDEGGTDNEEFRCAALVDRVNTTMQVWMGVTMGCAQCHTHKYDPIAQREYYQFMAFFNQTEDADLPSDAPTMDYPTDEQAKALRMAKRAANNAQEALAALVGVPAPQPAPAPAFGPWHAAGPFAAESFEAAFEKDFGPEAGVDVGARYGEAAMGWRAEPNLQDGAAFAVQGVNSAFYFYRTIESPQPQVVELGFGSDDGIKVWVNNVPVHANAARRGVKQSEDKVLAALNAGTNTLLVKLVNGSAAGAIFFRMESNGLPMAIAPALAKAEAARTPEEQQLLSDYKSLRQKAAETTQRLAEVRQSIAKLPVMKELPADQRRITKVFDRGSFLTQTEPVEPGTPAAFPPFPEGAPRNRLGLAQWLVNRDNPLTARVMVNRYWEHLFGAGIVTSTEDFGTQGEWPTHPELLDWLAVNYMDNGWSTKKLLRLIVTSETYRLSSQTTPEKMERDPYNRLLARGPRFRLEAETIRDEALRVAGLMSEKMYGPSVMPPQPDGLWQIEYSQDKWVESKGEDKFRRGLYTFLRRTDPYPSFIAFDSTSREVCTVSRIRTNTPLQALVTMNDPVYIEAAQGVARRIVSECQCGIRNRAAWAFRTVLCREPSEEEVAVLTRLYHSEFAHYRNEEQGAVVMASQPLGPLPEGENPAALAAWTVVANTLMNTDEFLTKR